MTKSYRPDIDGLRAIAVLAILLFHIDFGGTPGGFIGVDVFFVISGFLITRNIVGEIKGGTFSFADFYTRRALRLFPAFFFTLATSFVFAYGLFSAIDMERFGKSLLYTVLSASNFYFWKESGYFDSASALKPLLHTWSLSIEEQFYLIWPAMLVGLSMVRKKYAIPVFLVAGGAVSLYLSQRLLASQPTATFFLLPTRLFEFVIGAACVWLVNFQPKKTVVVEVLALIGLTMIVWATVGYRPTTPFPGYRALIPCLGAALLIYAGHAPITGLLLRNPIAVGLGRISYSVYLVHWPLLVFYKYWRFTPISKGQSWVVLALSIIFGALMWKFIETPFRTKTAKTGRDSIRFAAPILALAISFLGANTWAGKGFPSRFPAELFMTSDEILAERARYWTGFDNVKTPAVLEGAPGQKRIVMMGDSHGMDLVYALRSNGFKSSITFLQTSYKCFNFGTAIIEQDAEFCAETKRRNLSNDSWSKADAVFLHDHWPKDDISDLRNTLAEIRRLTSAKIYVFGPKLTYNNDPFVIAREQLRLAPLNMFSESEHVRLEALNRFSISLSARDEKAALNSDLKQLLTNDEMRSKNVFFVDVLDAQCGNKLSDCEIISPTNSKFLYFDASHFTAQGAAEFGARLKAKRPELFE